LAEFFISEEDARKAKWNNMPLLSLVEALTEHWRDRVIRADDFWLNKSRSLPSFVVPPRRHRAHGSESDIVGGA